MGSRVLENVVRSSHGSLRCIGTIPHARTFTSSSTVMKLAALPNFPPTSSPDLDALITSFRQNVFAPSILQKRHRDLIYKDRHAPALETNPISIPIPVSSGEAETYVLQHLNRLEEPRVTHVIKLLKEPQDFAILPDFFEALYRARRGLGLLPSTKARIVRLANDAGRQDVVVTLVRQVGRTGFTMDKRGVVQEVMWGAHLRARSADWEEDVVKKALKQAEHVADLLEDPRHAGRRALVKDDPRAAASVVGVLVELAATYAAKFRGGKDEDGKVRMYVDRLMGAWPLADFEGADGYGIAGRRPRRIGVDVPAEEINNRRLVAWSPVLHGLKMAAQVQDLNPEQSAWVTSVTIWLEELLAKSAEKPKKDGRGINWYNALIKE